eukprot:IDg10981t1
MSNFGVVSTISAPILESVAQPSLIQFETEYKSYQEKIIDIKRTRDEDKKINPASIKNCIEPLLLKSLCILGKSKVLPKPSKRLKKLSSNGLESGFAQLHMISLSEYAQPWTLSTLERSNASEVIGDKERCKGLIIKLTNKLEPSELKERIKNAREFWSTN